MNIFLLYQYTVAAVLLFMLLNFLVNNIFFKDISKFKLPRYILDENPLISILIPARNEEQNIKKCITSLIKQDYANIEILVLDDSSVDNTVQIVEEISKKDSRVILFHGEPLKKRWMGKTYACHQLAKYARGDYLIFADADTFHHPDSVSSAVACLIENKLDALSIIVKQIMVTIHERLVVPFGPYMILCFMPLYLIKNTKSPLFCTAVGQFMLFKKEVYEKIGGHKSVKSDVLDDIKISKQVKKCGYKFMIFDGRNTLYSRHYRNFIEVVRGHSKTLFAVFGYKIYMISISIIMISAIFLLPFLMLLIGIFFRWPMVIIELIILQITAILITKIIFSIRYKYKVMDTFLHPIAVVYVILIAINSISNTLKGVKVNWKGRIYDSEENDLTLISDNYSSK